MTPKAAAPASLTQIAWVFAAIGMQSIGGGMSAWIRREIVQRHGWLSESQFVAGMALSQITPGANGVNLAVFVGTTLRGWAGALAAIAGMLLVPVVVILALGAAFSGVRDLPGVESAMVGLGAGAIGLNAANGLRMTRRNVRGLSGAAVMLTTALAVGVVRLPLLAVLAVMVPVSLALAGRR
jgi:chromate transporter